MEDILSLILGSKGLGAVILNYYVSNVGNEQLSFLNMLSDELDKVLLRENQDVHFVFGGYWNLIFDKSLDTLSGKPNLKKNAMVELNSLMGKLDLDSVAVLTVTVHSSFFLTFDFFKNMLLSALDSIC